MYCGDHRFCVIVEQWNDLFRRRLIGHVGEAAAGYRSGPASACREPSLVQYAHARTPTLQSRRWQGTAVGNDTCRMKLISF
jgi:hypothetical protein